MEMIEEVKNNIEMIKVSLTIATEYLERAEKALENLQNCNSK